jgi:hypothetical protein
MPQVVLAFYVIKSYNAFASIGTSDITYKLLSAANIDGKLKALFCLVSQKQGIYFLEKTSLNFLAFKIHNFLVFLQKELHL